MDQDEKMMWNKSYTRAKDAADHDMKKPTFSQLMATNFMFDCRTISFELV